MPLPAGKPRRRNIRATKRRDGSHARGTSTPCRCFGAFPYTVAVECLATAFPLIGMLGSGIMAQRVGLALLANAIATGGALVALILAFGPRSGAL
jgi:hypothetical protein